MTDAKDAVPSFLALDGQGLAEALFGSLLRDEPLVPVGDGPTDPTGDHILNPDFADHRPKGGLKPAAVLVAVDTAKREPDVTLTVRTSTLSAHAGQIAFPGGRMDAGEGAIDTALREAHEEVHLSPNAVSVQGYLPTYASRTGYRVYPIVGQVDGLPDLKPNPGEVESIFQVPLRFLVDQRNVRSANRVFEGKTRYFYTYPYENYAIWGLTAGIIHHMCLRLTENWSE